MTERRFGKINGVLRMKKRRFNLSKKAFYFGVILF